MALCALLTAATTFTVQAQDTDAQAKAREALRRKMSEIQGTQPAAATTAAPAAPAVPVTPAADAQKIEQARQALRQKMAELEGQQKPAAPAVSEPRPPAPAVVNVPAGADPAQIEKAREVIEFTPMNWSKGNPSA